MTRRTPWPRRWKQPVYDDRRGVSPEVKFKDSELPGVPTIVVVGRRLADGVVEVKYRGTDDRVDVAVDDAVTWSSSAGAEAVRP